MDVKGCGSMEEQIDFDSGWLNVDECLSVVKLYGRDPISLYRPGTRRYRYEELLRIQDIFTPTKFAAPV